MTDITRPRVLCVDDEPLLLEGLRLHLGRRYELHTAESGAAGLDQLRDAGPFSVVISDMRMPGMSGAEFLAHVRQEAPESVRILLTGQTEISGAIAAVNEGQIFRFLSKPASPEQLQHAVAAAIEQHRLITAERELLEKTLMGSLGALADVLALANPMAFGRATRVKECAVALAERCGMSDRWEIEAAAMLSQIGYVTLDNETVAKLQRGQALTLEEQRAAARVPAVNEQLLAHIPRLENVRAILSLVARPITGGTGPFPDSVTESGSLELQRAAQIVSAAMDYDRLEGHGLTLEAAVEVMRGRKQRYDPEVVEALASLGAPAVIPDKLMALPLLDVAEGMMLAEDLRMQSGVLLAPRGYLVTPTFVERARNFARGSVIEPVRCLVPAHLQKAA